VEFIVKKILNMKLFDSPDKPWKLSVMDMQLDILCVSQFTLFANIKKGTKPDFSHAMKAQGSRELYEQFLAKMRDSYQPDKIKDGEFGAMMQVEIINDGPVTIIIDSPNV
jgi:D-tyrosyl-tRNA(Tyr) deacylase